ncbi:hypothetical protein [Photobacterium galatheae]|uniref:hypothetical protein n=1 Tax=Photobacterium galatheae TaxID=1654360 RepID=UPI001378EB84|nr:hypothetical protein [Photobacterium galatheae]MCM0149982.1 hypothetical protein [Photobacterium galatheae]
MPDSDIKKSVSKINADHIESAQKVKLLKKCFFYHRYSQIAVNLYGYVFIHIHLIFCVNGCLSIGSIDNYLKDDDEYPVSISSWRQFLALKTGCRCVIFLRNMCSKS